MVDLACLQKQLKKKPKLVDAYRRYKAIAGQLVSPDDIKENWQEMSKKAREEDAQGADKD